MRTSEMIAMLEENPKLRFTTKRYGNGTDEITVSELGYIGFAKFCISAYINIDDDWQLVREPVTLEVAIRAWANGKGIYVKKDGLVSSRYHKAGQPNIVITPSQVLTGKWYIDE